MRTGKIFDFMSGDANSIVKPRGKLLVEPCGSTMVLFWKQIVALSGFIWLRHRICADVVLK